MSNKVSGSERVSEELSSGAQEESQNSSIPSPDSSSSASSSDWNRPDNSVLNMIRSMIQQDVDPRGFCSQIGIEVPDDMNRVQIFQMLLRCLGGRFEARKRQRKCNIDDAIELIRNSKKIIVLTGAGISVSCGIPDFRSRNGLYAKLAVDFPELPDPQSMFCLRFFKEDPRPFFRFAKEIFPGKYKPSPSHNFIAKLEQEKKMTRLYSQNIDGLEQQAGIENVIQCHGHFYTAHCLRCGAEYKIEELKERILSSQVPVCEKIISNETEETSSVETCGGVIKPDIVFFGESLPKHFHASMTQDKDDVDLLIVMGSSLKVGPVNDIPDAIPDNVPRILINREPLPHIAEFEAELLGNCDEIVQYISSKLGYDIGSGSTEFDRIDWDKICEEAVVESENKAKDQMQGKIPSSKDSTPDEDNEEPISKRPRLSPRSESAQLNSSPSETDSKSVPIEDEPIHQKSDIARNQPNSADPISKSPLNQQEQSDSDSSGDDSEFANEFAYLTVPPAAYTEHPNGYATFFHGCDAKIRTGVRMPKANVEDDLKHNDENGVSAEEIQTTTLPRDSPSPVPLEAEPS